MIEIPNQLSIVIDERLRIATLSNCKRLHVGCVLLYENNIVSVECNWSAFRCSGVEGGCGCEHAEKRALRVAGNRIDYAVVTHSPCLACARELVAKGVKRVDYLHDYRDLSGVEWLTGEGVEVQKRKPTPQSR